MFALGILSVVRYRSTAKRMRDFHEGIGRVVPLYGKLPFLRSDTFWVTSAVLGGMVLIAVGVGWIYMAARS